MTLLFLALLGFGIVHIIPAVPRFKAAVQAVFGRAYGAVYGMASLLLLVACVAALRLADVTPLYDVPAWGRHANYLLTFLAFIFVGIFLFRGSWRNRLRYPMAIAATLWAMGHLLANGDTRTTLFFVGLLLAGLLHAFLKSRLVPRQPAEERDGHNLMSVVAGLALYGIMTQLHQVLIGVPIFDIGLAVPSG
jgi:uncharacterized membrane protein